MKVLTIEHAIRCTEPEFWDAFLDPEYTTRLFREVLAFPEFEIVHQEESETEVIRRCVAQPALGSGQKLMLDLFGKPFRFTEEGRFDKHSRTWSWRLEASLFTAAMRNEGTVRVEPMDGESVRRLTEITLAADVMVVGPMMEAQAEVRQRDGWDKSAAFMNEVWLARKPA